MSDFARMWADLTPVGREGSTGGYRRFAWTREDHDLREWFEGECAALGLDLTEDRAGNQWAWWGDPDADGPGVVTGSHLDSVPDGGAFDGPLGVVSALAAVRELKSRGVAPAKPLAVVNFVDEEGARFGVACAGSRIITGQLEADRARSLRDGSGTSMAEAWAAAGRDPGHLGTDTETLRRIGTFVELHVEQGRALVDQGAAVGVANAIWPHGRFKFQFDGEANHAGTTRLTDRHDAMLAYANAVIEARAAAQLYGSVATFGKVVVEPNGVNAVPSRVTAWLDARGPVEDDVKTLVTELAKLPPVDGVTLAVSQESWTPSTDFAPALRDRLAARLGDVPVLGTGAGHDAGILATAGVETAMLFVRNPTGVSHSPAEFAEEADCLAGVAALVTTLEELAFA